MLGTAPTNTAARVVITVARASRIKRLGHETFALVTVDRLTSKYSLPDSMRGSTIAAQPRAPTRHDQLPHEQRSRHVPTSYRPLGSRSTPCRITRFLSTVASRGTISASRDKAVAEFLSAG